MRFLAEATRNVFFTGKGGVGKTSLACATAIRLSDVGKSVRIVTLADATPVHEAARLQQDFVRAGIRPPE